MTTTSVAETTVRRQGFKALNRFMLFIWRLGLGSWLNVWPRVIGRFLVVMHTGRKSGKVYRTPLNYAEVDGELYVTAGSGAAADWYRNLRAEPSGEVWLSDGWWSTVATDITDSLQALDLIRSVLIGSGFAARVAGINPYTMTDSELSAATRYYRLVQLRRIAPRTGPSGPGNLAWLWPVATLAFLVWAMLGRDRHHP